MTSAKKKDPFGRSVLKKVEEASKKLEEIKEKIDELERQRETVLSMLRPLIDYVNADLLQTKAKKQFAKLAQQPFSRLSRTKACRELLHPDKQITTKLLFHLLEIRKYPFRSKRPESDLSTALRNSPHFDKNEKGEWYLVDPNEDW